MNQKINLNKYLLAILIGIMVFAGSIYCGEPAERKIGLKEIFAIADSNSKVIKIAQQGIQEAAARVNQAGTGKLPDIKLNADVGYLSDAYIWGLGNMPSGSYSSPNFYNNFSLEASYVIYAGGNIDRGIGLSKLGKQEAELNYKKSKMDIRLMLTGYYLDLYVAQNQREVLEKNIEQTKLLLENMKNRLDAGTILRSDLIRYELQLSNITFSLSKTNNKIDVLNKKLVETLDLDPGTKLCADELDSADFAGFDSTIADSFDDNVELRMADVQNKMAEKNLDVNKGNYLPSVTLFATDNLSRPFIYDIPPIDIYTNIWMAGVNFSFNIGNLYKNRSKVEEAKLKFKESETGLALAAEQAEINLHEAYVNYQESTEYLSVAQKELELATENYDMVINQYNNQLALITDVMDASNSKLSSELQLENAKASILFSIYKIERITGKL